MNNIFKMIKKLLLAFVFTIVASLLLYIINIISYSIPNNNIRLNIQKSIMIIEKEGNYYTPITTEYGYLKGYQYDNYTDSIILLVARDSTERYQNVFKRSISNNICSNYGPLDCLKKSSDGSTIPDRYYSRYWFGTSTILRLLLYFFNLQEIRYINFVVLFFIILVFVILLYKETNIYYCFAFVFTFLNIGIITIPFSLQFLPNLVITLVFSIILLLNYKKQWFNKYFYLFFLLIGILTSYFDLLTFPLITFAYPFILYLILSKNQEGGFSIIKSTIIIGASWLLGYIGTFMMKFVISSLILNVNIIDNAFGAIAGRIDANESVDRFASVSANYSFIFNYINVMLLQMYYILSIFLFIKNKWYKSIDYKRLIILLLICILPVCWYMVLSNHSYLHQFMTYRTSSITMLSLLIIPLCIINSSQKEGRKNGKKYKKR